LNDRNDIFPVKILSPTILESFLDDQAQLRIIPERTACKTKTESGSSII